MPSFPEDLLQFIWQHKLLLPKPLVTVSGKTIQVLKAGDLNNNSGPDFFNASIRLDDLTLIGNIEIHIKTSDWLKHNHQADKNYDNIILHVVYEHDTDLQQNLNNNVEILVLKGFVAETTIAEYTRLFENKNKLACSGQLSSVSSIKFIAWLDRLLIERLEYKVNRINEYFIYFNGDYAQTLYTLVLRSFGNNVNALPFELLAKQLPLTMLLKHADNLFQLEALLLGTSGLLNRQYSHDYIRTLQNEFEYLKTKYNLIPLNEEMFKFSRMRPASFPDLKLIQFATLLHKNPKLFLSVEEYSDAGLLKSVLEIKPQGYWANHYMLDGNATLKEKKLGKNSAETIIINAFAPFLFFFSNKSGKEEYIQKSINLIQICTFEINSKTNLFLAKKELLKDAGNSQALIQLYDNYCVRKKCLNCGIGAALLNPKQNF